MNLGLVYQLQNRTPEAMSEFRSALKLKPKLAGANFFLGVDSCKLGQARQAIPHLQAAARAEPRSADIWSWLATAQEAAGQPQAEVETLKHALALQPKNADLWYLLGRAYEKLAKEQATSLQHAAPNSPRSEQMLAESYATSTHWSLAVLHFQNALAISPDLAGLHIELGEVLLRAEKLQQASEQFEAELKMHPRQVRAITRRGEVKLILGDVDGALDDWTTALAIDSPQVEKVLGLHESGFGDVAPEQLPDATREKLNQVTPKLQALNTPAARLALAFLASQYGTAADLLDNSAVAPSSACSVAELRGKLDQGHLSGLGPCIVRLPQNSASDLRLQLIGALVEAGDYEEAAKTLAGLSPAQQNSPDAAYWRARCYERLATAAYLQLYRADPGSYRLHQLMADLESMRGDDAKAIEEYRAAIAAKPDLPNLHYSLGHLLWKDLKVPEARAEFEAELAINPRHPGALHDLGNTYLSEYRAAEAKTYLLKAEQADAINPDIHGDLGTAYSQLHDTENAEKEFKLAVPADHDGSIHYKLGRLYQLQGRKEEAAREFALSSAVNRGTHEKLEKQTQRLGEIEHSH
jgi:tetratricopeptide (TPR) repeat protein